MPIIMIPQYPPNSQPQPCQPDYGRLVGMASMSDRDIEIISRIESAKANKSSKVKAINIAGLTAIPLADSFMAAATTGISPAINVLSGLDTLKNWALLFLTFKAYDKTIGETKTMKDIHRDNPVIGMFLDLGIMLGGYAGLKGLTNLSMVKSGLKREQGFFVDEEGIYLKERKGPLNKIGNAVEETIENSKFFKWTNKEILEPFGKFMATKWGTGVRAVGWVALFGWLAYNISAVSKKNRDREQIKDHLQQNRYMAAMVLNDVIARENMKLKNSSIGEI